MKNETKNRILRWILGIVVISAMAFIIIASFYGLIQIYG